MTSALIIDDEPDIRELLSITLDRMSIKSDTAANVSDAKRLLENKTFNICLTDMKLPDGSGLDIVKFIQKHRPELPVAVITAHGNMDTAVQAMKAGAFDFVNKPIDINALRRLVSIAIKTSDVDGHSEHDDEFIGDSPSIHQLKASIKKLSRSQAPVYISGESGSGKELVAKSIHMCGPRHKQPFVPVNCGAIPAELMESEFFGHKKGTFTGATQDKLGLFQAADGGTLFLDEVADLPLDMQVKLLRAIQEKAIRPVGAHAEIQTDVRILCATHKDLQALVDEREFRQDLYYRLNVIQLQVPSLRERAEDVTLLVDHFLERLDANNPEGSTSLSKAALAELTRYSFPGNIRELENILERAYTLCDNAIIEVSDLLLSPSQKMTPKESQQVGYYAACQQFASIDEFLAEIEREILSDALEHVRWNKTLAAKKLGISFRSFRYRLSKLGLDTDDD
ncbi:MAG: sigma-54-dependent Fis family transcriptional regulator [Alteromonadaceae bacterium]|nr:MAG: sigma-54-dependent Fis family transcriptional regulator [Alteromonadaceae bacterium]